ncbi:MAG TPA: hydrogenase maturation nickel metallochaperone HypA [Bryobacteraceae bacterium]|nr:hydrogenase maturation nickel metallochaperone HypA [Bryobacteraceae bacterium]
MGIASSILDAVRKEMVRFPGYKAAKVQVRIGEFAGVDRESLQFCFEAIVKDSSFARLELDIQAALGDELDLGSIEIEDEQELEKQALEKKAEAEALV